MPLSGFIKKASSFILGSQSPTQVQFVTEGEIIFSKNNVCVHPPTLFRQDTDIIHHPGYLTLSCQTTKPREKPTLVLTWIPNSSLRHNPSFIEKRSSSETRCGERRRQSSESCTTLDCRRSSVGSADSNHSVPNADWLRTVENRLKQDSTVSSSNSFFRTVDGNSDSNVLTDKSMFKDEKMSVKLNCSEVGSSENVPNIVIDDSQSDLLEMGNERWNGKSLNYESHKSVADTDFINKDDIREKMQLVGNVSHIAEISNGENIKATSPAWMISPESLALQHNLTFPESATASPVVRRTHRTCRKFSVDLSEMRSLRLFFSDAGSTQGQLVVASRQCQYKILHFHHGGLDRLAGVLQSWNLLTVRGGSDDQPYRHFMVCRPAVNERDLHPEEGTVSEITLADWQEMFNSEGLLEDDVPLRKVIFLGGLSPDLRKTVWPFLLHCYSFQSTQTERDHILQIRRHEYYEINSRRESLEGIARERFQRNIQCVVEKDVVRTDRSNPYFAGDSNPHVQTMLKILLNYAVYNASLGYTQGMSDLLAPVLAEIEHEADAFWCFVGLMRRGMFVCTPTDSDMERNLNFLRELIREMVPKFYEHLQRHTDAMELLFCHRWILLCFKREFPEAVVLRLWEACWSNYLTDHFHLFVCVAIVSAYADDVIAQDLRADEMLLHFSSLAMFMDGNLILKKARGLLYQFRERPVIPCSLVGLCQLCSPGMWDSNHAPTVVCRGAGLCPQDPCPYRGINTLVS